MISFGGCDRIVLTYLTWPGWPQLPGRFIQRGDVMAAKLNASVPAATHEIVEETDRLPVFFSTSRRGSCTSFSCSSASLCCSSTLTIPLHWHEYVEFIYLLEDTMDASVQSDRYELRPGDLLIINSGELHSTKIFRRPMPYLLMQLSAKRLREIFPDFELLHFVTCIRAEQVQETPRMRDILLSMRQLFEEAKDGYQLLFTARLYEFLHILYEHYCTRTAPRPADTPAGRDQRRVAEIVEWTQAHFREPLTLEDAAGHLGISREYFCRIFKKHTGQTYLAFLCATRTMNLYNQLLASDLPIPLLMEENGLTNYKTFLRTFRDMYGTTPQRLRSENA